MNRIRSLISIVCAAAVSLLVAGCETTGDKKSNEELLVASGFKQHLADTAQKQKLLASLPAGRISTIQKNGHTYYVYPDMANNSALVGTNAEYQSYLQLKLAKKLSDQNLEAAQLNAMPPVGWGAWGGWAGGWGGPWGW
jgi:hypothetical protein